MLLVHVYIYDQLFHFLPISYPTALEMVARGVVNAKPLITHTYNLDQAVEAFAHAKSGKGGAIKVMIHCGSDE